MLQARKWLEDNRKAGAEFLAKELEIKPKLAEQGLDYYLAHRAWEPDLGIDLDGLKTVINVYAEQADMKGPIPSPEKYVDLTYLQPGVERAGLEMIPKLRPTHWHLCVCAVNQHRRLRRTAFRSERVQLEVQQN